MEWFWFIILATIIYFIGYYNGRKSKKIIKPKRSLYEKEKGQPYPIYYHNSELYDEYYDEILEPSFEIEYCDAEGEITLRQITPLWNMPNTAFRAWCHLRDAERTFRNERILTCIDLESDREIKNLKEYIGWNL